VWRYSTFRPNQRRIVVAALLGRDCLAVLPTGGGKSLCFQVPALLLPGVTIVVSPLISLMQDQVAALRARGLPAAYLSSTQKPAVQNAVRRAVAAGKIKLLYVAPERLPSLGRRLAGLHIAMLAVDEAHCISEWGHDFRPHYRAIGRYRVAMGGPPTIALTATATPETRRDIARVLGLRHPVTVLRSFDRPNLRLRVHRVTSERDRVDRLTRRLREITDGAAVVYVPTRDRTDAVAQVLRQRGFRALPYHAGLPGRARKGLLTRFLDGRCQVIVATNAFGMGIDKPDVRLVAHLGVPPRPEAYFQEAGRAGRDGKASDCVVYWLPGDLVMARRLAFGTLGERACSGDRLHAQQRALDTMRRYVMGRRCRRRVLLEYLGERLDRCSGCDRCDRPGW